MNKSSVFIVSATISIFLTGCLIIAHDLFPDFKQVIATLTGHHWMSVSVIIIILFVLFSGLLLASNDMRNFLKAYKVGLWSTALIAVTLLMVLGVFAELITRYFGK